jgi:hypothetical protein
LLPPKSVLYFVRNVDDDGNSLRSDCIVTVEGPAIPARWWALSSGDQRGAVLSAGEAVLDSKGQLKATISRHPSPGNWIVPPDSSSYTLSYILSEPSKAAEIDLPHVKRIGC